MQPPVHTPALPAQGAAPMTVGRILTRSQLRGFAADTDIPHWHYLSALEDAARYLGIPHRVVDLVRALFAKTQASDWQRDPIVWPSNDCLMQELDVGRSQVKRLIRAARDLGLIDVKESANGRRYGYRDRRGNIAEAYGFSLKPLALRHQAFVAAADDGRQRDKALLRGRRRLTALRREIVELARLGHEHSPQDADWTDLAQSSIHLAERGRSLQDDRAVEDVIATLEQMRDEATEALSRAVETVNKDPMEAHSGPSNTSTKTLLTSNEDSSGIGRKTADRPHTSGRAHARHLDERDGSQVSGHPASLATSALQGFPVTPDLCLDLAPVLGNYLPDRRRPTWAATTEAAFMHRGVLGISRDAWIQGCTILGREVATVIIAIITRRHELGEVQASAGGLFRAMIERGADGTLHLDRTLHRLVRQKTLGNG